MTQGFERIGNDGFYLDATARLFGWEVAWETDGRAVRMSRGQWTVDAVFRPDGGFCSGTALGPGAGGRVLALPDVVALLEDGGSVHPPAA